jgi:excisionase family DNA binding protein
MGTNCHNILRTGDRESNRRLRLRHEKSRKRDEQSAITGTGIPTITPRVLRIAEAAKYIGATNWRMETLLREKKIRSFIQGKRRVVDIKDLDAWIEAEKRK